MTNTAKTIRIAIDGNEANVSQRVGSNAYAYELLWSLFELVAQRSDIQVTVLLARPPVDDLPTQQSYWQYRVFGPSPFWTQWALPLHLFLHEKQYDVLFTPGHYAPRVSRVPYVSSVMDLAFFEYPRQFRRKDYVQLKEWTRYSVKHAQAVVAISEFTKQDIHKRYRYPQEKIVVAYPGISQDRPMNLKEKERLAILKKWSVQHPFILYVGTLQPRKNLVRLIEAFERIVEHHESVQTKHQKKKYAMFETKVESLQLVIAGKVGWLADDILHKVATSPVKDRIIVTGYVTEEEKTVLYQESVCTILVGLYEGFGIPILEAMKYGSLPVVSKTTSLPEVVGEGGVYVDPEKVNDIAAGILEAIELPAKERAKILKKARQQVKKFTWAKAGEQVLETLVKVAKRESIRQD